MKNEIKEKFKRNQINFFTCFFMGFIFLLFIIEFVSAADVAYVYNRKFNIDNNVKSIFSEMGLSVDYVQEKNISKVDFSKYKIVFIGDERFSSPSKILINKYPSVISNYFYGYAWGLTDGDGISSLARSEAQSVKKNNTIIQVYTQGFYNDKSVAIPYYYLGNGDKADAMQPIAVTYSGNGYDWGDVISYAPSGSVLKNGKTTQGNICFFGIIESTYWTDEAKKLFKDCINYVGTTCSTNSDCPSESKGAKFCNNGSVYENVIDYSCQNPGSATSKCVGTNSSRLVQTCSFGCSNSICLPECTKDSDCSSGKKCIDNQCVVVTCSADADCGTNGLLNQLFCNNNNVFDKFLTYKCNNPGTALSSCTNSTADQQIKNCSYSCGDGKCLVQCSKNSDCLQGEICSNNTCVEIACSANSDCGINHQLNQFFCKNNNVFDKFLIYTCNNAGTIQSSCINSSSDKQIQTCLFGCLDGQCLQECTKDSDCSSGKKCINNNCVVVACSANSDCGNDRLLGQLFCKNNNVFDRFITYVCNSPGTALSSCTNSTADQQVQSCVYGCSSGQCTAQCSKDSDCGTDFTSQNYCKTNSVYYDTHHFTCQQGACNEDTQPNKLQDCPDLCSNGQCVNVACTSNTDCGTNGLIGNPFCQSGSNNVFQNFASHSCNNPGTSTSSCTTTTLAQLKTSCLGNQICLNGQCKTLQCRSDSDCDDSDLYTYDQCNNPGTTSSYCSHTTLNCVTDNDCGITGYFGAQSCLANDVYKNYQESKCINPKTTLSYCNILITQKQVVDCGSNFCEDFSQNYCKGNNLYHSRTCHEKGCSNEACFDNVKIDEQLLQTCKYGCANGDCLPECTKNSDCSDGKKCINNNCVPVVCSSDNECGTSTFVGNPFCQAGSNNVFQNFITYTCNNAGTATSSCSSSTSAKLKTSCSANQICQSGTCVDITCFTDSDCNDNNAKTLDKCINPGTPQSSCQNTPISCFSNADCGTDGLIGNPFCQSGSNNVFQNFITYTCNNPGTLLSLCTNSTATQTKTTCTANQICSNGACSNVECFTDNDCNDNNAHTFDKCLNPGTPQSSCTHTTIICLNDADCNDNNARTEDKCNNPGTINSTCSHNPIKCLNNADCGTDGFIGNPFCQTENTNVFQNFITFTCNNAGTALSSCTNSTNSQLKTTCAANQLCSNGACSNVECFTDNDCNDNNARTEDKCLNPGTINSTCSHNPIKCLNNAECGTDGLSGQLFCKNNNSFDKFITFTCNNAGTALSSCTNSTADQQIQICPKGCANGNCIVTCRNDNDCNDNNARTEDKCLNPGTMDSSCTHTPINCASNADCGTDGFLNQRFCINSSLFDKFITYTCNNAETSLSFCSNTTEDRIINQSDIKTITYSSRNAPLGSTGYCKQSPILIYSDLTGVETIQINDISGYICSRSANGACSDNINTGCQAAGTHKQDCSTGTQGTIGLYDINNKLIKEYSISEVKNGVNIPAGAKSAYVYFKDSFYSDNNGGFKCTFNFIKTMINSCKITCTTNNDCGDDRLLGQLFCKNNNSFDKFITYTCNNPGTPQSSCTNSTADQQVQSCVYGCSNGQCNVCINGSTIYVSNVISVHQGLQRNGLPIPGYRSDTSSALGAPDSKFFSLGMGGTITLSFQDEVSSITVRETNYVANPEYQLEIANVEISADGSNFVSIGTADNKGSNPIHPTTFSVPAGTKYVRVTDISPLLGTNPNGDGFDLESITGSRFCRA